MATHFPTIPRDEIILVRRRQLSVGIPSPLKPNLTSHFLVTFSLPAASPVIIVLTKYNTRYFKDIQGPSIWNLDFVLAKEGETELLAESSYWFFYTRGVSVELDLEAGNYVVLVSFVETPFQSLMIFLLRAFMLLLL